MPIFIVVIIVALLIALAAYAFISQSIEKKRVQKQRILMTLKTKQRNFVHLINGFPPNFLTNDLLSLIYRALIDTCEQLSKIEPKEQRHQDDVTLYTNQLDALPKNTPAQRARVENPQVMKDIRQHLQELQHFLIQQESIKAINKVQFSAYIDQIKRLALQMSVDAYLYHAKQAQQAGKLRLAIHYFNLAKKLLTAENASRAYDKQIAQLDGIIGKLEEKAQINGEPEATVQNSATGEPAAKEWDNFAVPEDAWKKKQIYD
jgi:type II secretory pathway pseudopilin PulG